MRTNIFTRFSAVVCMLTAMAAAPSESLASNITINKTNFPDDIFRQYVLNNCDADKNQSLSDQEIADVTTLFINNMDIADLTGIGYFSSLNLLACHENKLTALDVSKNTALTELYCTYNRISGEAMDALIEGLPVITDGSGFDGTFCVFGLGSQEQNVVTKSQVSAAIAKGWMVLTDSYGTYEGSDGSTFISSLSGDSRNLGAYDCWYDLQGRRLNVKPTSRGI